MHGSADILEFSHISSEITGFSTIEAKLYTGMETVNLMRIGRQMQGRDRQSV